MDHRQFLKSGLIGVATGALRWKITRLGPLAGAPLALNDGKQGFIFASKHGLLTVVDGNGQVRATKDMSEPLGSGPVAYGGRLLLAGWAGTLYLTDVPQ